MSFFENIRLAWEGLRAGKMRAFLTMLGIIIGISSVIGILTLGDGLTGSITGEMSSLGATNIYMSLQPKTSERDGGKHEYGEDDLITDDAYAENFLRAQLQSPRRDGSQRPGDVVQFDFDLGDANDHM